MVSMQEKVWTLDTILVPQKVADVDLVHEIKKIAVHCSNNKYSKVNEKFLC